MNSSVFAKDYSKYKLLALVALFLLVASQLFSQDKSYKVFLIGDAGYPQMNEDDAVLDLLKTKLQEAGENSAVVFLGDNIYPDGLPPLNHKGRKIAEARLKAQLDVLKNYKGRAFVLPGNHDWKEGRRLGLTYVNEEQKLTKEYLNNENVFFPKDGCPGPVELPLSDNITLIILDTQWWLHPWDKPEEESDCDCKDPSSVLISLEDMLLRNAGKKVIVAAHHPLYSHGPHGGYYPLKSHLFPLTDLNKKYYFPFPVLGSLYPFSRKFLGNIQDISHPKYRLLKQGLTNILKEYPGIIYASGHDHSLQYLIRDSINYIVSGSGSKITYVRRTKVDYTAAKTGFGEVIFREGRGDSLIFYQINNHDRKEKIAFSTSLISVKPQNIESSNELIQRMGDSAEVKPSDKYKASRFKEFLLGENYRKEWQTPVKVPVFNIEKEKGGLKILQRGGGMQTKSLRLLDNAGIEYVLRSIEKYPENAIPKNLRGSFAQDLIQDQISASHPYAALAVSALAESAGIPHTHPKIVFIPNDKRFGRHQRLFANTLALFEERNPFLKENKKVVSTSKVLEKLKEDNDIRIDQQAVLKARLFDVIIGDWDRHDDQWRWFLKEQGKEKIYSPIPRDRDQAFFLNEGVIPEIASRRWALPKIQGFDKEIRDIEGFMFNGRYFDRTFLTKLSKEEWIRAATELKKNLNDSAIENSLKDLPEEVYGRSVKDITSKLKQRTRDLEVYALKYYNFLSKNVDVAGSDKRELFRLERREHGATEVNVFKINKKNELEDTLYSRTFYKEETKEIRLYGLGGDDVFTFSGKTTKGIKVRIIGGEGSDLVDDNSEVKGIKKYTLVYDSKEGNQLAKVNNAKVLTSDNPAVNQYDRKDFKYNLLAPLVSLEYNIDDGIFIGGGFLYKKHAFRKDPFSVKHKLTANYALNTSSYNFSYQGYFTDVVKRWDFLLDLDIKAPNYVNNFFGLGNESEYNKREHSIRYYRVRFQQATVGAFFVNNFGPKHTISIGPHYSRIVVEQNHDRFINNFQKNDLSPDNTFDVKDFAGFKFNYSGDSRDSKIIPTQGVKMDFEFEYLNKLKSTSFNLYRVQGSLSFYYSFKLPARVTLANRIGAALHLGDYEFFQANYLGGLTNLRGYRKTRFGGESSIYNNTEIRLRLFNLRSYIIPSSVGLMIFNDVGRVWYENERSKKWHQGYGGGIWLSPFNSVVISLMYGVSEERGLALIKLGFMF